MTKIKIIVIGGILVLSIFVGLLIQISLREPLSKSEQTSAPTKELSTLKNPAPQSFQPEADPPLAENVSALPIPKPDLRALSEVKPLPDAVTPFFENINKTAKIIEKSLISDNAPTTKTATITSDGIILSLTKEQFNFLYPDKFIAGLTDVQNLLIKEFNLNYEPLLKIETDAQVRLVEEKIVAALLSNNMITKEKSEQFITTIRFTLPELQLIDLQKYYSHSYETSPLSKSLSALIEEKKELPRTAPKRLFLAGFMEELKNALTRKAQAAVCGYCVSLPLCFQEGAATPGVPGSELFYPSCYCTGCLSSLGCLSANNGQAAIYDPETGICGVGL
ncbi:MAG: hypothetical protein A3B89_01545 [Candidatus Buchananbacteria bacterium RIFCSPHIGHO2_02_FULL_40_13]|nr:MAG: hypothetical protein A3B89_01545 [Candidatus Buchananbacteria bacterium RIFCSPHIGHO2_02_FULL_40_13]